MNNHQRQYKITLILSPNLEEKNSDDFSQKFEQNINKLGGKIINKTNLEHKELAYPIKKFETGYFLLISFMLDPEKIKDLEGQLKHDQNILRYMINYQEEQKETFKPKHKKVSKEEKAPVSEKKEKKTGDIDKKIDEILGR